MKRLKYIMMSRFDGGEWLTGSTLISYKKAYEYAIKTSNEVLDCVMIIIRGDQFEYETKFYGISESERYFKSLIKKRAD